MFEDTNQTVIRLSMQFFAEDEAMGDTNLEADISEAEDMTTEADDDWGDLFSDESAEAETAEPSEEQPAGENATEQPNEAPAEETLNLKFLGKDISLSKSAAQSVADALGINIDTLGPTLQKGLNYDHAVGSLQNSRELRLLDEYARMNGMDRKAYLDYLERSQADFQARKELDGLRQQYPDAPEELLRRVSQQGAELQKRQNEESKAEAQRQAEIDRRKPWQELFAKHPDLTAETLPPRVFEMVSEGMSPMAAYLTIKNEELTQALAAEKKNKENRQIAVGPVKGTDKVENPDPFMDGFESVFR